MVSDRDAALRRLETEFGAVIRRVRRALNERAGLIHPDLPAIAYLMLGSLADQGPQRASMLAETFFVDKGAVSRQVSAMERLGLLERTPDPQDGRASILRLTDDGARRVAAVKEHSHATFEHRLGEWSDADLSTLAELVTRYNDSLNATTP